MLQQLITNLFTLIATELGVNSNGVQMDDLVIPKLLTESLDGNSLDDYLHSQDATETKFYRFFSVRGRNDIS